LTEVLITCFALCMTLFSSSLFKRFSEGTSHSKIGWVYQRRPFFKCLEMFGFPTSYLVVFFLFSESVNVRGDDSFCWYW